MSTIIGRAANLMSRPTRISTPQMISNSTVEIGEEGPCGNTRLVEPARAECLGPEELQDAFADEDQPHVETDEHDGTRGPGGGQLDQRDFALRHDEVPFC